MATIVDQEYTATDIIKKDLERGGFTKNEQKILKDLTALVQKNKAVIVRHNNTVFVGVRKEPGVLEVHMFTLDPAAMLPEAMKIAFDTVKKAGVTKLKSETINMRFVQMLKQLGPVKTKKNGSKIEWTLEVTK
jgi:hypothetical protein